MTPEQAVNAVDRLLERAGMGQYHTTSIAQTRNKYTLETYDTEGEILAISWDADLENLLDKHLGAVVRGLIKEAEDRGAARRTSEIRKALGL